jgi:uncharacterized protein
MIAGVFDCVVYVQAAISDQGPAAACLSFVEEGKVTLFTSPAILVEVRETLSKQKLRNKFPHLTDERVEEFLQEIVRVAKLTGDVTTTFFLPRDPDDAVYVHLALTAKASHLVTRDKDLLSLMDDVGFRKQFPELSIVDPATFLEHVRATPA